MRAARRSRRYVAALVGLLALVIPGGALADTPLSHSGTYGPHRLAETASGGAGARCLYGTAAHRLDQVRALAPLMKARDDTPGAGNDPQKVAWRAIFQGVTPSGFRTLLVTGKQFAIANDDAFATFPLPWVTWTADGPGYQVRVLIDFYWYGIADPANVVGFARHRVDYYRHHLEGSGTSTRLSGYCRSILP